MMRIRSHRLDVRGDSRDQPATADCHKDRVDRAAVLPQDFHANSALAGDDVRIVIRMHEAKAVSFRDFKRFPIGFVVRFPMEKHFSAARLYSIHLDARRRYRHHNQRPATQLAAASATP